MEYTTDLWFASFLAEKGHKIKDYKKIAPKRGRYFYEVDKEEWKQLKLAFLDSPIMSIKKAQDDLRDLLH